MRPESHSPHRCCSGVFETSNQVSSDRPKVPRVSDEKKTSPSGCVRTVPRSPFPLSWHSVCNEHDGLFLTRHEGLTRHRSRTDIGWRPDGRDPDTVSNARLLRLTKGHTSTMPGFISTTRRRKELLTGPVPSRESPRGGRRGHARWQATRPDGESQDADSEPQLARPPSPIGSSSTTLHGTVGMAWRGADSSEPTQMSLTSPDGNHYTPT